jgi:hypothetical protein
VTLSSCWIASLICEAPISCSRQAALISETSSAVLRMSGTRAEHLAGFDWAALTVSIDIADLGGGGLAALGQLAHFGGDDGEALAMLAGTGGLDGGVQSQKVGLAGDLLDDVDLLGDGAHGAHGAGDGLARWLGILGRLASDLLGLGGVVGVLLDVGEAISSIEAEASSAEAACSVAPWRPVRSSPRVPGCRPRRFRKPRSHRRPRRAGARS